VFYGTNIANRLTIQNFYMTFGGTSWGWLPAPVVYTSYDYGAAISEARQLRPKAATMKELGLFLQSVDPVTRMDKGATVTPTSSAVKVYHNVNTSTGTHFYVATHNPSSATTNDTFRFGVSTADGSYTVPQSGTLRLNGQDAKILVAGYDVDGQRLVYSTSEIMTHKQHSNRSVLLLYGRDGESGETVLRYSSAPTVQVAAGAAVTSTFNATTGDLRLNYSHSGLAQVRVSGGGRPALLLLLASQSTADTMWRQDTAAGPVLERGPALVRTATVSGSTLALTGDTTAASSLEVWAPPVVTAVTWNGSAVPTRVTSVGSLAATSQLAGPAAVTLPDLSAATWRFSPESPEAAASFGDSAWATANRTSTNSTTKPPAGQPVLTADDYGFHHGDVWYRGRFSGLAPSATVGSTTAAGRRHAAGLAGRHLPRPERARHQSGRAAHTGTATLTVPTALRTNGNHVLSVMVRNNGHNEDGGVNDAHKEGRGLIGVTYAGSTPAVTWKIQGNLGGETLADPVRGAMNAGGLFGERNRWQLPGFPDSAWATRSVPDTVSPTAGTSWYRTTFTLSVPSGHDASLGLTIGDPPWCAPVVTTAYSSS
jgi:beta-galactosidase GanA